MSCSELKKVQTNIIRADTYIFCLLLFIFNKDILEKNMELKLKK